MPKFTHVVFSKGLPAYVDRVRELVGVDVFKGLRWFVAHGERNAYVAGGAQSVRETGDLCHTVQRAIGTANQTRMPLTFMSDDVRGFYCKQGDPVLWGSLPGKVYGYRKLCKPNLAGYATSRHSHGRRLPDVFFQDAVEHARYELPSLRQTLTS